MKKFKTIDDLFLSLPNDPNEKDRTKKVKKARKLWAKQENFSLDHPYHQGEHTNIFPERQSRNSQHNR